jgi:hypothetical protein
VKNLENQMKTLSVDTGKEIEESNTSTQVQLSEMSSEIKIMETNITTSLRHDISIQNQENQDAMLASLGQMIKELIKEIIKESVNQNMNLAMAKQFGTTKKKSLKSNVGTRSVVTRSSVCTRQLSNDSHSSMEDTENVDNKADMSQIEFGITDKTEVNFNNKGNM